MDHQQALEKAEALVLELEEYKDSILIKEVESAQKKIELVEEKLKSILVELDQLQLSIENKAVFFFLRGKALNIITSKYDARAVECLSKAVKLDPSHIQAWNELGDCYWKNKEFDAAANCFTSALSKHENKESFRNLSMVQRQLGSNYDTKVSNINESVETAKKAVKLDLTDGQSWFVLGNAYLSVFFFAGQNPSMLKQCMAAYTKAVRHKHFLINIMMLTGKRHDVDIKVQEKDERQTRNADLYYNRAVAYKYQEHFSFALADYHTASKLDATWSEPREDEKDLRNRLKTTEEMISKKGNFKPKRITTLMKQMKDVDLGPYASGFYTGSSNQSIALQKSHVDQLVTGINNNKVILGKVIAVVPVKGCVPFVFVLLGDNGFCVSVSVFNLAVGKGLIIGDSVAIPEPYVEDVKVQLDNEEISFRSIRVENPLVMVINRRKVGSERLAFSVLSVFNKSD